MNTRRIYLIHFIKNRSITCSLSFLYFTNYVLSSTIYLLTREQIQDTRGKVVFKPVVYLYHLNLQKQIFSLKHRGEFPSWLTLSESPRPSVYSLYIHAGTYFLKAASNLDELSNLQLDKCDDGDNNPEVMYMSNSKNRCA